MRKIGSGFSLLILTCSLVHTSVLHASESLVQRLRCDGIRSMVNGDPAQLAAAGFNMTIPWERPLAGAKKTTAPDSAVIVRAEDFAEEQVEKLHDWARRCKELGSARRSF